ncbi:MAG: TauD/TfdA family dioxygenase [Dongiaceae bacterium]
MTALAATEPFARNTERIDMSDLADWPTDRSILSVDANAREVTLGWDDGVRRRFHAIWLRDNCPCTACRHPQARERRFLLVDAPRTIAVDTASLTDGGNLVVRFAPVAGEAAHESRYDAGWLRHHGSGMNTSDDAAGIPRRRLWDADIANILPTVTYADIMQSDAGLAHWLRLTLEYGFVLMRDAPAEPGVVLKIARRIQDEPRVTNFGAVYDVLTQSTPNNSADTTTALEPHTDLANWRNPPDIQLLFCVENEASGGGSILVDGCRVAEELRKVDPASFALLASHPVEFRYHEADCDIRYSALSIETDAAGSVVAVRFNNWLRAALDVPEELVEPMYDALLRFWRLLREQRFQLTLRLAPGQMLTNNNLQIMHGREAYDPRAGRRHLQGCYVDLDMIRSRLRVLSRRGATS